MEYFLELVKILPQLAISPKTKWTPSRRPSSFGPGRRVGEDQERITNHDVKAVEYFVKTPWTSWA